MCSSWSGSRSPRGRRPPRISTSSTVNVSGTLHAYGDGSTSANKTEHDGYVHYTTGKIQCHVGDYVQADVTSYDSDVDTPGWTCRV